MPSDQDRRPIDKALVGAAFERAAPSYDRAAFSFFGPFARRLVDAAGVAPGDRVLDVACGTGAVGLAAAEAAGRDGGVHAIDLVPAMVDQARAAAAKAGVAMHAEVGDAERLIHDDAEFDVVLCGFGIFFLPDVPAALAEWKRVLRPGGTLAVSTWDDSADERWAWERGLMREYAPRLPQPALVATGSMLGRFDTAAKVGAVLADAGFEDVTSEPASFERSFEDPEQWWAWTQSHGNRMISDNLAEADAQEFRRRGLEEARSVLRDGPVGRRFAALLTVARRPG
jgi:O-methyltransferase/aklanonic acid methyltransferase